MTEIKSKILIVDDEASIGQVMQAGLEAHGFEARYETSSVDTVAVCLEFHPDLVLLDIDMPDKDGGQVASELRAHPTLRHIPVVFLSSLVGKEEQGQRNAAREMLLSKPIRIGELAAIIRTVLRPSETAAIGQADRAPTGRQNGQRPVGR